MRLMIHMHKNTFTNLSRVTDAWNNYLVVIL